MEVQTGILYPVTGLEGLINVRTGAQIPRFDSNGGISTSWLVMTVLHDLIEIAIILKGYAFTKIIYINHVFPRSVMFRIFTNPMNWAGGL
jgi:hypothetical protein